MKKGIVVALLLAGGAAIYWVSRSPSTAPAPAPKDETPVVQAGPMPSKQLPKAAPQPTPPQVSEAPDTPTNVRRSDPRPTSGPPAQVEPLPSDLANVAPETALENMRTVVRQYGSMFAGNPVGTNPEITQALQGENPKHINFLKADGNRVNSQGELVDVWGTPYFFHQISGTEMEIRSAGPDHVMYTGDDLVIK